MRHLLYTKMLSKIWMDLYETSPVEEGSLIIVEFELHQTILTMYLSLINTGASIDLSRHEE